MRVRGARMSKKRKGRCPCSTRCDERRVPSVNLVLEKGLCTSNELRQELQERGIGKSVIRKSVEFLSSNQCKRVETLVCKAEKKPLQFPKHGRLFYRKNIQTDLKTERILSLLTPLQTRILEKFSKHHRSTYYFSPYDLRKLVPYAGNSVEYAISRLSKLGLVEMVTLGGFAFFTEPKNADLLRSRTKEITLENKVEFAIVQRIHELIMNLYPLGLITNLKTAIRPRTEEVLRLTGGMTFDIFYMFREPVMGKKYLAVDVYSRIPVNGYIVNSFLKKLEWAKTGARKGSDYSLKDKTHGMIVFKNSTRKGIDIANKRGIRFIRLTDAKINSDVLHKEIEDKMQSSITPEQIEKYLQDD